MSSIFRRFSSNARLGDLLVQAGFITPAQLQDAVRHSRSKKLQIGQVLVMSNSLSSTDLQMGLEAQSMVRDRTIDVHLAVQCMKLARKLRVSFHDALEDYDSSAAQRARTGKLGELLRDAGLISESELFDAMERSVNTGMPLGRVLVLNNVLSSEALDKALDIQIRLRDEMISREDAITELRSALGVEGDAAESTGKSEGNSAEKRPVRLGELLVMSGILSEGDVMDALEWGLQNQQSIGNVLVSQGLISEDLLDAALQFQNAARDGKINELQACECLSEVYSTGLSPEEALEEVTKQNIKPEVFDAPSYQQLLQLARVISNEELEKAFDIDAHSASVIGKVLVLTGHFDVPTLQATLRCFQMMSKGWLTIDDAVASLDYCLNHNPSAPLTFEQALRDLKWSPETGIQLPGEKSQDNSRPVRPEIRVRSAEPQASKNSAAPAAASKANAEVVEEPSASEEEPLVIDDDDDDEPAAGGLRSILLGLAGGEPKAKSAAKTSKDTSVAKQQAAEPAVQDEKAPALEPEPQSTSAAPVEEFEPAAVISEPEPQVEDKTSVPVSAAEPEPEAELETAADAFEPEPGPEQQPEPEPEPEPVQEQVADPEPQAIEEPPAQPVAEPEISEEEEPEPQVAAEPVQSLEPEPLEEKPISSLSASDDEFDAPASGVPAAVGAEHLFSDKADLAADSFEPAGGNGSSSPKQAEAPVAPAAGKAQVAASVAAKPDMMDSFNSPELKAANTGRGGRFSQTILPEHAKASLLSTLVDKETMKLLEEEGYDRNDEDPDNAGTAFKRLADKYFEQGKYKEAQGVYERMLVHHMNSLGPNSKELVDDYNNLAMTLCLQNSFDRALPFMKRAISVFEANKPADPVVLADYLHSLATIEFKLKNYEGAQDAILKVLLLRKDNLAPDHEDLGRALADYAKILKRLGKDETAEKVYNKARQILKR